jgi:hypothetical protein
MVFSSCATLLWLSGGLVIRYALPTWVLLLYCFISLISFFALAAVRHGLLYGGEEQPKLLNAGARE